MVIALAAHLNISTALSEESRRTPNLELARKLVKVSNYELIMNAWVVSLSAPGAFKNYGYAPEVEAQLDRHWRKAIKQSFRIDAILEDVALGFSESFSRNELKTLIALNESRLGRKITQIEKALYGQNYNPQNASTQQGVAVKLLNSNPRKKKLIEEIVELTDGIRAATNLYLNMTHASWIGAEAAKPFGQPRLSPEEISIELEKWRPDLKRHVKPIVLADNALRLISLDLAELRELRDFGASNLGKKLARLSTKTWNATIRRRMMDVGEQFVRDWNQPKL